jgi:hypothetical protein
MPEKHLTRNELSLLLDGESEAGSRHVETCAFCRSRLNEMGETFSDFVQLHHESLNEQIPPIAAPCAQLRSRLDLAKLDLANPKRTNWLHPVLLAAACLTLIAIYTRPADRSIPKNNLTPGETRNVSLGDVCREDNEDEVRAVPVSLRQQVFREYGINDMRPNAYEVDYLITPELGGATNSLRNLWPEPYSAVWNAHVKDELEQRLHGLVCAGQLDLATAQHDISRDWIGAYKKYFHTDKPY